MTEWKSKRFWTEVDIAWTAAGWQVQLDGRPVRTPSKFALSLPTMELANLIAVEWRAQEGVIRPDEMPATRMANSAIEKVQPQKDAVVEALAAFGETDLLCYRADGPGELIQTQSEGWDPVLNWAASELGAQLKTSSGVMPVGQPSASLSILSAEVAKEDIFGLAALHDLIHMTGSLVLGLAVARGALGVTEAWSLSRIDEEWQISQWGRDDEADDVASRKRAALIDAEAFYRAATAVPA